MAKSNNELIDLLLFTVNEKANEATKQKNDIILQDDNKAEFWRGQYMAFSEMYSLLLNIKRTL